MVSLPNSVKNTFKRKLESPYLIEKIFFKTTIHFHNNEKEGHLQCLQDLHPYLNVLMISPPNPQPPPV